MTADPQGPGGVRTTSSGTGTKGETMPAMLRTLVRRWPLTLGLLLICGGLGMGVVAAIPPTYQVQGSVVLIPPPSPLDPNGNRYLLLGGVGPARDLVMRSMSSEQTHDLMVKGTKNAEYSLEQDYSTSAPIVVVTASAHDARSADVVLTRVLDQVPKTLLRLQEDLQVKKDARLGVQLLTRDDTVHKVVKKQVRALLAVVGAAMVGGVLLIGMLDGMMLRRVAGTRSTADGRTSPGPEAEEARPGRTRSTPRPGPLERRAPDRTAVPHARRPRPSASPRAPASKSAPRP